MPAVKLFQYEGDEALIAMSFFGLGWPITLIISFLIPGLGNAGKNHLQALSTTVARGYVYGPPNGLLFGIFAVLSIVDYWYYKYTIMKRTEDMRQFKYLYITSCVSIILLFIIPPVKVQNGSYSYVLHHIVSQVYLLSVIAWHSYLAKFVRHPVGRHLSFVLISMCTLFLVISWIVGAASSEAAAAPFEWFSFGCLMSLFAVYVFVYESEKYACLNAPWYSGGQNKVMKYKPPAGGLPPPEDEEQYDQIDNRDEN